MSELYKFFTDSGASLGTVFYPEDFVVATMPSDQAAIAAATALADDGFAGPDLKAVSGAEMVEFVEEFRAEAGISGKAVRRLSRFTGTEAKYADADLENARHGCGFVVVRCNAKEEALRAASIAGPFHPVSLQWYRAGGVESMV